MKTQLSSDEITNFYDSYIKTIETDWRINMNNMDNIKQMYLMNFIKLYVKKRD